MPQIAMRYLMTKDKGGLALIRQPVEQSHIEKDDALADIGGIGNIGPGKITMERMTLKRRVGLQDDVDKLVQIFLRFGRSIDLLPEEPRRDPFPSLLINIGVI